METSQDKAAPAGGEPGRESRLAGVGEMLADELARAHRAAVSGIDSVTAWSDKIRDRNDLSALAVEKHTEMIGRLGHNVARMMATVQRAAITLDWLERADSARPSPTPRRGPRRDT